MLSAVRCNVPQKCSTENGKMRAVEYYSTQAILQNTQAIRQNLLWEIFEYFALNMEITEKIQLFHNVLRRKYESTCS